MFLIDLLLCLFDKEYISKIFRVCRLQTIVYTNDGPEINMNINSSTRTYFAYGYNFELY